MCKFIEAGEFITRLEGLSKSPKAYTSVQCGPGPDDHVELNSDLVFGEVSMETLLVLVITNSRSPVNHSCEPNVAFDLSSPDPTEWHVRALSDLKVGTPRKPAISFLPSLLLTVDAVTFFYPSTEWAMSQVFDCQCGANVCFLSPPSQASSPSISLQSCLKRIQGAAHLPREELAKRGFINSYIWAMMDNHDSFKVMAGASCRLLCGHGLSPRGDQQCGCKPVPTC